MARLQENGTDQNRVIDAFANAAAAHPFGIPAYFNRLVQKANVPAAWRTELAGAWSSDPWGNALTLTKWAIARGINPSDARYTMIGSFLEVLLGEQGLDQRYETTSLIVKYGLYRDGDLLASLKHAYQWPDPVAVAPESEAGGLDFGPDIEVDPALGDVELQGFGREPATFEDVGFSVRMLQRAASVCRIETSTGQWLGSGFLVAPGQILTNAHVVDASVGNSTPSKAAGLVARFGFISGSDVARVDKPFPAVEDDPLSCYSPVSQMDIALLNLSGRPEDEYGVSILPLSGLGVPVRGTPIHLLGHPSGMSMQLSRSTNGVSSIDSAAGLLQYVVTRTERGSSGSPCFDDDWRLVAIHHAQRRRNFGLIREGILLETAVTKVLGPHL